MEIAAYADAAVAGVPLLFVVLGFVEWLKSFKDKTGGQLINGNWLLLASMFVGLILGGGFMITKTRPPAGDAWIIYVYWFVTIVYGIGLGIVASGIYNAVKRLIAGLGKENTPVQ